MFRSALFWLFVGLLLVVAWAGWHLKASNLRLQPAPPENSKQITVEPKNPDQVTIFPVDPVSGARENYQVTIVEFSDFECPYCQEASYILKQVLAEYPTKVRLIWKDLPVPSHTNSVMAAIAAQCAGAQGKFWQYHDNLFANQKKLGPEVYNQLATNLQLDQFLFSTCLESRKPSPLINKNIQEAKSIGIEGVPYLIVNGQSINGVPTLTELRAIVEGELK